MRLNLLLQVQDAHDVDFELLQLQSRVSLSWREGRDGMEAATNSAAGQLGAGQLSRLLHTAGGCLQEACLCRLCLVTGDTQRLLPQAVVPATQVSMHCSSSTLQKAVHGTLSAFLRDSVQMHSTIWLHEGAPAPQQTSCQLRSPAMTQTHDVTLCV